MKRAMLQAMAWLYLLVFQFLWGWNRLYLLSSEMLVLPFNSFEDETLSGFKSLIIIGNKLSIPLRMKPKCLAKTIKWNMHLSIPLRMKHIWKFEYYEDLPTTLSIPLRMKLLLASPLLRRLLQTFNSFEDETLQVQPGGNPDLFLFQFLWGWNLRILRWQNCRAFTSFNSFEDETNDGQLLIVVYNNNFQFLWGWNWPAVDKRRAARAPRFQFLWGWNIDITNIMIHHWLTFNSFEDETGNTFQDVDSTLFTFQFLWGWNACKNWECARCNLLHFQFLWGWNHARSTS